MVFLEWIYFGNPLRAWLLALVVAAFTFFSLGLLRTLVLRHFRRLSERTHTRVDDLLVEVVQATRAWFLVVVSLWAGSLLLVLPDDTRDGLGNLVILFTLVQLGLWAGAAVGAYTQSYTAEKKETDPASVTSIRALGFLARVGVWALLFLVGLDNLGFDVTALVAGLGIGGIAVALAVQNILGDLFASLSIVIDKPFVYGDFIIVGDFLGTVEHVGLKTTRVRSLSGEQLIFSNSDLLNSRIRNFKRMMERRALFSIGVTYQTPREQLERIPEMIRETIEALPDTRFDRAHFKEYGDSSLNFEIVYYVLQPEYNLYMDRQQAINLELYRRFEAEGIEFAYPTRTVYMQQTEAR